MFRKLALLAGVLCLAAIGLVVPARADIVVPGADGSDGAFNPTDPNTVIDLSLAPTGTWNGTNQSPGHGVYDPDKWAVVFRYTSVNIPSGVTVKFRNHPAHAPVVWLVSGNITMSGTVSLDGETGHLPGQVGYLPEPGPGGFRGGRGWFQTTPASGGFGPGGTRINGLHCNRFVSSASFGTSGGAGDADEPPPPPTYGAPWLLPIIGGSGGGGGDMAACQPHDSAGGGAGGGAIVVACAQAMTLNAAQVRANGGSAGYGGYGGNGSGGGIRLVADTLQGTAILYARGGTYFTGGGKGRIRLEASHNTLTGTIDPAPSVDEPGPTAVIWPADTVPSVRVVSVGGVPVPADPHASFTFTLQDVLLNSTAPQTAVIEARHVPLNWYVLTRMVPKYGPDVSVFASYISGDETLSTWHADLTFPNGFSAVQVRASQTPPPGE